MNCKRNLETGQLSSNNLSLLYVTTTVERHRIVGVELYDTKATFSFLEIVSEKTKEMCPTVIHTY